MKNENYPIYPVEDISNLKELLSSTDLGVNSLEKEEHTMTLIEKFATLTPAQRERFDALKDGTGLDAFLSETELELSAEEKEQATELITSGKLLIPDGELDAAVGASNDITRIAYENNMKRARADGRSTLVEGRQRSLILQGYMPAVCPKCNYRRVLWCRSLTAKTNDYYECVDTKCYRCDYHFGTCDLMRGSWEVYIQNWEIGRASCRERV